MKLKILLQAIGSTEPSTFNEICRGLGDNCPERGDSQSWGQLFRMIEEAEVAQLITVSRTRGSLDSAILTEAGVAALKQDS